MTPTIQTVYLPAKVEESSGNYIPDKSVLLVKEQDEMDKHWIDLVHQKQGYFFTPEQLNELLSDVIKDTLNTAAIGAEIEDCGNPYDPNDDSKTVSEKSMTDKFEEIFQRTLGRTRTKHKL